MPESPDPVSLPAPPRIEFGDGPALPTVVVRRRDYPVTDLGKLFDATFGALFPALAERGIRPRGAPFALYTRPPTDTADLEIGVRVSGPLDDPVTVGDVTLENSQLPGGRVAHVTHVGGYDGLPAAWDSFMTAITAAQRTPILPFWEVYTTEPTPDLNPADLRTDLYSLVTSPR